tara:strand:+ start:847 stop:957 length:111 start_codon:yes stop_codon:yes gene_type:complete
MIFKRYLDQLVIFYNKKPRESDFRGVLNFIVSETAF